MSLKSSPSCPQMSNPGTSVDLPVKRLLEEQLSSKIFQAKIGLDSLHIEITDGKKALVILEWGQVWARFYSANTIGE